MQLTIIRGNKLSVFNLPKQVSGSYWITDFENGKKINLINVEAGQDGWTLISNQDAYIMNNKEEMIPNIILKNYGFYILKNNYKNEKYYLYCSPVYDTTFRELGISEKVSVGADPNCTVCYQLGGIPRIAFNLEKEENYYYLNILDATTSVYVNQKRVLRKTRIEYGDIIFIFGLKLILMKKEGVDVLLVNNPNNLLGFNPNYVNIVSAPNDFVDDNSELTDDSAYAEQNYFYRTPHFYKTLEDYIVNVDVPPAKKDEDKTPAALTIGPMITMAMTSIITLSTTLNQIRSGDRDLQSSVTSLAMSGAMLASGLLWPILTRAYQKFSLKLYEKKRQKLYRKYIDKKELDIDERMEIQRKSLLENNFSVADCQNIIRGHNIKLWQRRITDEDFLTLPVGIGDTPMKIEIKYPEEHFTLEEDNLLDIAHELGKKERILKDVPITFSFYDNKTTGIVGNAFITKDFIDRLILQMFTNYSYDELKIVIFTSLDNEKDWEYLKVLPHVWSNDKSFRYFGSSNEDYREIIYNLEKVYNERMQSKSEGKVKPQYVIITDAIKSIDNYDFIKNIMSMNNNIGFNIIMLVDKVTALPNECKSFISVSNEECQIYSRIINSEAQKFKIDYAPIDEIYNCAKILANIPIDIKSEVEASLPDSYKFLEMYQVGKVEQLNALDRWKKSNPILSLQAPVGIGKSGEVITLDLHEKYHGPHGLIAGTTGSGKSEFILTYILSLAINYHPYEVQIILIDYKGGSLAGSFSNANYSLPHIAGTITNLDGNELNRSLDSIESEVKRRQKEFNDARVISGESSIDIYKYQKLWREGRLKDKQPIAHLFIISDEFAELKEQQPEFMEKLISIARVGRSLGVHLILATQKPGGVVDSQIWSNTKFRVCLKVQDTGDSQEVLKKPDAAYLKKTGRFYLQVGYDEVYTLGQAAWAGGQYYPSQTFRKDVDTSVNEINNIGFITKSKDIEVVETKKSLGEELPNVVKYLSDIAKRENIQIRKLWLDKIPEKIYIDNLISKYSFTHEPYVLNPIIGEYDDPSTQNQYVLTVPFTKLGNSIIYGIAGSGKENFLTSLIYSCMVSYKVEEVNFYAIDFGAETLRVFENSPYVGDVIYLDDSDKLKNLFKMIYQEIEARKEKFSSYGGSFQSYIKKVENAVPNIVIIINNYEAFLENYEELAEELAKVTRESTKYGIYFVLTASNGSSIRMRTRQNFNLLYALQQNDDTDYFDILGNVRGKVPAKLKGRGLFKKDNVYEFQTAYVTEQEDNYAYLNNYNEERKNNATVKAPKIPVLPKVVDYDCIKNYVTSTSNLVIGINKNKLAAEFYDFKKNAINLISAYEIENTLLFLNAFMNEVITTNYYELILLNTTDTQFLNDMLNGRIYTKNFDELIEKYANYINEVYDMYEKNNFDESILLKQKNYMVIIYDVYDFINKLKDDTKKMLNELIKKDNQINLISFVLVDNPDVIKAYNYDEWFKTGVDSSKGIFIGSGIVDQSIFKVTKYDKEDREEITNEFGYVIKMGKLNKVKLLSNYEKK